MNLIYSFNRNTIYMTTHFTRLKVLFFILFAFYAGLGCGQVSLSNGSPSNTQNFDGMAATTTLPTNWKMQQNTAPTWAGGTGALGDQASSGTPTAGASYNWGTTGGSERCAGVMTSGSYSSPNSLMAFYTNAGTTNITDLTISYDAERYRINSAAASVKFFYSLNGTSWNAVTAGDIAAASFPTGSSSYTFGSPLIVSKSGITISSLSIAPSSSFYLRWNLNTTGSSSQGIGIDNVVCTATFAAGCTAPTTQASAFASSSITTNSATASWTRGNGDNLLVVARAGSAVNADPTSGTGYTANAAFGSGSQIGTGNYVVYNGTGTSVNLTGLASNTTYHFAIYEYNNTGTCYNLTELTGNFTTNPADVVLNSANPAVAVGNITQATTNNVIYSCNLTPSLGNVSLTGVTITTAGTYAASNLNNLKCWYSSDATFNSASDNLLSTKTSSLGAGSHVFPSFTAQSFTNGATGYIFITTDLPCGATNGNTIAVNAITTADLTFAAANKSGTAYAGGTQTITSATPNNVTAQTTSNCQNGGTTVSWTAPSGCSDNVLVFAKAGSFTAAVPSGDGISYTANTVFGSGTGFDGGFCVFKGTSSTVNVTGLTNGTNYTYKIFTRNDLNWTNGVTTNCTPTMNYCTATTTNSGFEFIDRVVFNTLDNSSSGDGKYQDWTSLSTTVEKGLTYDLTVYNGNSSYTTDRTKVYIDYNNNGSFADAGEQIGQSVDGIGPYMYSITIPLSASTAAVRMRIRLEDGGYTNADSCGTAAYGEVEDYTLNIIPQCVSTASVTSFVPASGSPGTKVTITGTGFIGATAVKFNSVNAASFTVVNATTIVAEVPANAVTGKIAVLDASACAAKSATDFTVLNTSGTCTSFATDLIISEVFDAESGNTHYIEIYNGTGAAINLNSPDYKLYCSTNSSDLDISGTIAHGATLVVYAGANGDSKATSTSSVDNFGSGFNENDYIRLKKGGVVIDELRTPTYVGYTMIRNANVLSPVSSYNSAEWTVTNHSSSTSGATIGSHSMNTPNTPVITANPTDVTGCSFTMSVTATGSSLSYQWKYNDSLSMTGWSNVTATNLTATNAANSGVSVSGATTNSLSITGDITNLLNYQFYCEVTSSGCTKVTNAAQFYYDSKPVYRTKSTASGNWTTVANWEMALSTAGPWTAACTYPKAINSTEIYIESGITLTMDKHIDADYLEIKNGGTLKTTPTTQLTIYNGNTSGADFKVLGTYEDNSNGSNSLVFGTSAKWEMGASGTVIKTNLASADVYRTGYLNGMVNMPATATWIYRNDGTAANNPTTSNAGLYYPNLYFENTTGAATDWSNLNSTFRGNVIGNCTVYGNMYIGTTGSNPVKIYNNNLNATPMLVYGNVTIGVGSEYTIQESTGNAGNGSGTGINVKGNITNNGTFDVNTSTSGIAILSGTSTQVISGAGTFDLWNFELNKPTSTIADEQVDLEVKNNLNFVGGILVTGTNTMYVSNLATSAVSGGVTSGTDKYVQGRLKWKTDATSSYVFPIGYSGYGAQGFTIDANAGTSGADVLAYLETNNSAPDYAYGYYDFEDRPTGATGNVPVGSGNTGFDGILDQINFNLASPLQWHITNPNSATAAITNYDITVHANGTQDIISSVVTSKNGAKLQYLMKNGEPGNDGATAVGNSAPQFTQTGFLFSVAPNNYVLTGLSGFSKFTLDGVNAGGTILPVTWLYLKATPVENSYIRLDWATASERNNNGFEIERSTDAKNYSKIDFVSGNGTTTAVSDYTYNDLTVEQGITYYYRLRQIDYNGNADYSNIVSAKLIGEATADVALYPNPVKDILTANLINMKGEIVTSVYNALGQIVISNAFVNDANIYLYNIDLAALANGNYTIVVKANNDIITKKVIVAK